jgi:hypothetical protein
LKRSVEWRSGDSGDGVVVVGGERREERGERRGVVRGGGWDGRKGGGTMK